MLSLYLHFPFCKRKCSYCDFCSFPASQADMEAYCEALKTEIALYARRYGRPEVDTVFLGGGTPSAVPARLMEGVLAALRDGFALRPGAEFTAEANPGALDEEWLDTLRAAGLNRLSLGVQAIQPGLLHTLGRIHDFAQAKAAVALALSRGVANLNADAMFGLPGQSVGDYLDTLRALADTGVPHISAYALIVEEHTPLARRVARGELALPSEDETADMLEGGVALLQSLRFERYEISNFSRPGYRCAHNLAYWRQTPYLGLGLSAAGLLPPPAPDGAAYIRRSNVADLRVYTGMLAQGCLPVAEDVPVSRREAMFETVMLGLRTADGVRYADFAAMHGQPLEAVYGEAIQKLRQAGLLAAEAQAEGRLALSSRGLNLQSAALMPFMEK